MGKKGDLMKMIDEIETIIGWLFRLSPISSYLDFIMNLSIVGEGFMPPKH